MKTNPEQVSTPPNGRPLNEQEAWRRDFPIDVAEDNYVARRDFTKFLVLTSGAFAVGQLCIGLRAAQQSHAARAEGRKVATLSNLPVGGALTFDFPRPHDSCILLRPSEGELLAFSQRCTHLSCAVVPDHERNCLHCPCHEGSFDISTGKPLSGPPRRPLPRITIELRGEEIWATGVEERTV